MYGYIIAGIIATAFVAFVTDDVKAAVSLHITASQQAG